ncbi:MAG: stage III sporulation protein AB [Christensenellales bacterium]|jgi:stage III sporulation protein AB
MKLIFCLIIVVLSGYIGRLLSKRVVQRMDFFREYQSAIIYLTDRVVGMNLELFKALNTSEEKIIYVFFEDCSNMLRNMPQTSFTSIWKKSFEKNSTDYTFLNRDDIRIVLNGGEAIEALCRNPTEKQAETYTKRLAAYIAEMEADMRKKCKLYNTSGILAGLFIALLVI